MDTKRIESARNQFHWATQALSAACDAALEKRSDDSQSSLIHGSLVGGALGGAFVTEVFPSGSRLMIDAGAAEIGVLEAAGRDRSGTLRLAGATLDDALAWVGEALPDLGGPPALREYDMPGHPFGEGAAYDASDADAQRLIAELLSTANSHLRSITSAHGHTTDLLLWPHHLDLGSILLLSADGDPSKDPCVGIGYSLGDGSVAEPYYYANAYAVEKPAEMPNLGAGRWADGWFGAVLTRSESDGADEAQLASSMIHDVLALVRSKA